MIPSVRAKGLNLTITVTLMNILSCTKSPVPSSMALWHLLQTLAAMKYSSLSSSVLQPMNRLLILWALSVAGA